MNITTMSEAIAAYDEMLDEVHGEFMGMSAARILRECEPDAVGDGVADWADAEGIDTDDLEDGENLP